MQNSGHTTPHKALVHFCIIKVDNYHNLLFNKYIFLETDMMVVVIARNKFSRICYKKIVLPMDFLSFESSFPSLISHLQTYTSETCLCCHYCLLESHIYIYLFNFSSLYFPAQHMWFRKHYNYYFAETTTLTLDLQIFYIREKNIIS